MDWKDFFQLSVMRETKDGTHPYFHSELKVPEEFSMDELLLKEFDYLGLHETEKRHFSLNIRKIILRHHYFHTAEFERIANNFCERLLHEKDRELTFTTTGGGIYLFLLLLSQRAPCLNEKKLICYTSELPIHLSKLHVELTQDIRLIYRPEGRSFLKNLPGLWQNTHLIALFEVDEA